MIDERELSGRFHAALDVEPPPGAFDRLAAELARRKQSPPAWRNQLVVAAALILVAAGVAAMISFRNATQVQLARHGSGALTQPYLGVSGLMMAYDARRRETVLVSGIGETWVWDGHLWTRRQHAPDWGTSVGAMAYDGTRGRIVLLAIGGRTTFAGVQTWTWDGQTWKREHPRASLPLASSMLALSDDPAIGQVVLMRLLGHEITTWSWDGHDWHQIGGVQPPAVASSDVRPFFLPTAYDPNMRRVITLIPWSMIPWAFTTPGPTASAPPPAMLQASRVDPQTWAFDGKAWQRLPPASAEPSFGGYVMGTDGLGRLFLIGSDREMLATTFWRWSGSVWIRLQPSHMPPPMGPLVSIARDPATGGLVMTGTYNYSGGEPLADETWVWDGRDWMRKASLRLP